MTSYSTRNDAFSKPSTLSVGDDTLLVEAEGSPSRSFALADLAQVRLTFAPNRVERARYRCDLTTADGSILTFFNRRYRGVYDFEDTSADYVAFVRALHVALAGRVSACSFVAGASRGAYLFNALAFGFLLLVLLATALFFVLVGMLWLIALKALFLAIAIPMALRWFRRNKPRSYDPRSVPSDVLPGA